MAVPLLIAGGAAAAGLIGTGIAAATGAGKTGYRATNFGDTTQYDPNKFAYGGHAGGAHEAAIRYKSQADLAHGRQAANAQYGGAQYGGPNYEGAANWETRGYQAREHQGQMAGLMAARAQGLTPSISGMQAAEDSRRLYAGAQDQMQRAQAAQMSASASARGPQAMALAQQNAANNIANAHGTIGSEAARAQQAISGQAQVNAANERMMAEQGAFQAYSGMRGGDQANQGMGAQMAQYDAGLVAGREQFNANLVAGREQFNAQLSAQQRAQNDAFALGMTQNEMSVQNQQLNASLQQQGLLANSLNNQQAINSGINQQNAAQNMQYIKMGIGAVSGAAGMAMPTGGGKADGGPVRGGTEYLVGERGPERVVFPKDGIVIPNERDQPPVVWGDDGRAYANTAQGLAPLTEKPRTMQYFRRDTPADQARVRRAAEDDMMRRADGLIAGYRKSLGQGASVARDEGELYDAPPAWLADYMGSQQPTDDRIASYRGGEGLLSDARAKREAFIDGINFADSQNRQARGESQEPVPPSYMKNTRAPSDAPRGLVVEKPASSPGATLSRPMAPEGVVDLRRGHLYEGADPATEQLAEGLAPRTFEYRDGMGPQGARVGITAQNAERQPMTSAMVSTRPDGLKQIDQKQGLGTALAAIGHLARKQAEVEATLKSRVTGLLGGGGR